MQPRGTALPRPLVDRLVRPFMSSWRGFASARTAEWNYLKGIVNYRKGWLDNAVTYLNTACAMEPNNMEYRQALNQLTQQQRGYAQAGGTSMCEVCASLYCANACCQCMGGGC